MDVELAAPLGYSNWVLLLGVLLVALPVLWVVSVWFSYRNSSVEVRQTVRSLSQLRKERYLRQIDGIESEFAAGNVSSRDAHLALAALVRACASERTGRNVESATAKSVADDFPDWPELAMALRWCADQSFPAQVTCDVIEQGVRIARLVAS